MQATVGLRARKKEATREAVIDAAYALFLARGFDRVTIDEIADGAGISRRTYFRYFPTKEDVVFPRQADRLVAFRALLATSPSGIEGVRTACLATAESFAADRSEFLAQGRIIATSQALIAKESNLDIQWEDALSEHLSRSLPRQQARWLAGGLIGLVRAVLREWREDGATADLAALGIQAFELLAPVTAP